MACDLDWPAAIISSLAGLQKRAVRHVPLNLCR
jgi:hypothetical protein